MNTIVVLANAVSLAGSTAMAASGLCKTKKGILGMQILMSVLMIIANVLLGGMTGAVLNGVNIVRNLFIFARPFTVPWRIAFIVVQSVISVWTNTNGWIGLLPVLACAFFTWFIGSDSEIKIKYMVICTQPLWLLYDIFLMNYIGAVFDGITIISNIVGIYAIRRDEKKKPQ